MAATPAQTTRQLLFYFFLKQREELEYVTIKKLLH